VNICPLLLRMCTVRKRLKENMLKFLEIKYKTNQAGMIVTVTVLVTHY